MNEDAEAEADEIERSMAACGAPRRSWRDVVLWGLGALALLSTALIWFVFGYAEMAFWFWLFR